MDPVPDSYKCLKVKNHFGSSSEVSSEPDAKKVSEISVHSFIHSFISAIMIHSEHVWSPYYVPGIASAFMVLSLFGERQTENKQICCSIRALKKNKVIRALKKNKAG